MRACVRACVRACMRACLRVCVCVWTRIDEQRQGGKYGGFKSDRGQVREAPHLRLSGCSSHRSSEPRSSSHHDDWAGQATHSQDDLGGEGGAGQVAWEGERGDVMEEEWREVMEKEGKGRVGSKGLYARADSPRSSQEYHTACAPPAPHPPNLATFSTWQPELTPHSLPAFLPPSRLLSSRQHQPHTARSRPP